MGCSMPTLTLGFSIYSIAISTRNSEPNPTHFFSLKSNLLVPFPYNWPVPADPGPLDAAHFPSLLSLLVRDYGYIQHLFESGPSSIEAGFKPYQGAELYSRWPQALPYTFNYYIPILCLCHLLLKWFLCGVFFFFLVYFTACSIVGVEVDLVHSKVFLNSLLFDCWIKGWEEGNKATITLIIFLTFKILVIFDYVRVTRVLHAPWDLNDIALSSSPPLCSTHISQGPCPRFLWISWGGGIGKIYILMTSCDLRFLQL